MSSPHEDEVTIFAEMTSDEFFAGLPTGKTYDLIFIDGLHTFEQAYRDLCNAIVHSHDEETTLRACLEAIGPAAGRDPLA
ncbi:MAG TPA: class I SAM-dependent methyltransferase [Streptosporangiaceae bacterium]|jgi:hypothetical protein|nr:class I SAM-dependent methyltransferase [Streptosporangiaceae bacterium]